jgi:type II secretory pathway component PulF
MDSPRHPASLAVTFAVLAVSLLLWALLVALLIVVVPGYERTLEDFRMRLPVSTELAILGSRYAIRYWYLLPPLFLALLAMATGTTYLIRHRSGNRWLSAACLLLLIGLPLLANGALWAALSLPLRQLQEGLAK